MIRNVVLIKLKEGATPEQVDAFVQAIGKLDIDGMRRNMVGRDLGLREGNYDLAVVNDFEDEDAYRAYDSDPEHHRIRREIASLISDRVERCQFALG